MLLSHAPLGNGKTGDCVKGGLQNPFSDSGSAPVPQQPESRPEGSGEGPVSENKGVAVKTHRESRDKSRGEHASSAASISGTFAVCGSATLRAEMNG